MTDKEFMAWLRGYLQGCKGSSSSPTPVVDTILDNLKTIRSEKMNQYQRSKAKQSENDR